MLEREVKIRFPDPDRARAALAKIGAVPLRPRRLQDDTLFDTADGVLRAKRAVVRLRREPDRAYVTFKGPVQPGTMKIREEQETEVGDAEVLRRVLRELGLHAWFRYQKFREEFQAPGVIIALDETPVGTYLEIEGSEQGILTAADVLPRPSPLAENIAGLRRLVGQRFQKAKGVSGAALLQPDHAQAIAGLAVLLPQIQKALTALRGFIQLPLGMQFRRPGAQAFHFLSIAHATRIIPGSACH